MAAEEHLSNQQFFHGSDHEFEPGDKLSSPIARKAEGNFGSADPNRVYLSNSRTFAKGFGEHVYRVQPDDEPVDTGYIGGRKGETRAYHVNSATVVKRMGGKKK